MNTDSPYKVQYGRSAAKELRKLDKPVARRIKQTIDALSREPRPPACRPLTGHPGIWRIRVGDYRIVYTIYNGDLVVLVLRIAHRSSVYKNLPE